MTLFSEVVNWCETAWWQVTWDRFAHLFRDDCFSLTYKAVFNLISNQLGSLSRMDMLSVPCPSGVYRQLEYFSILS